MQMGVYIATLLPLPTATSASAVAVVSAHSGFAAPQPIELHAVLHCEPDTTGPAAWPAGTSRPAARTSWEHAVLHRLVPEERRLLVRS